MGRDLTLRMRHLRQGGPGQVWLAVCSACGHMGALPVGLMLARYGELEPVETALRKLRCDQCREVGKVSHRLARLCEPGCHRQRG